MSAIGVVIETGEGFMNFFADSVAVITGAGSGMGRCLAQRLAAQGTSLALADVNEKGLAETKVLLGSPRGKISLHLLDVAKETQMKEFAAAVEAGHGRANLLFNNAGVALLGNFEEISLENFRWLMDVNFWGVIYGTAYFLPMLKREKRAHIINTSSLLGFVGAIGQSAYCASKFAVRGFTESLQHELKDTNVSVTCVHPGFVRTSIAKYAKRGDRAGNSLHEESMARFQRLARTDPDVAAAKILKGVEKRKARVLIGVDSHFVDIWQRLRPSGYWGLLAKQFDDPGARK
jgi:NAD(P)-dependent dehydrogenase (short-subunit alcohol dehydrogenase family)